MLDGPIKNLTFNTVHFKAKGAKKALMVSNFARLVVVFRVKARRVLDSTLRLVLDSA